MQAADLPTALAHEGDMMLTALLSDLLEAGYDDIVCTRDPRLRPAGSNIQFIPPGDDVWQTWRQCMRASDAVWLIAPETGNALYELSCLASEQNCRLIGCTPAAVKLAASKSATIQYLIKHQIPCPPVLMNIDAVSDSMHGWVIKPDDGAGGEDCRLFTSVESLRTYIAGLGHENFIIQEYLPGIPASISMLCHQGQSLLLACNEQLFGFHQGRGRLSGIVVNGLRQYARELDALASAIGAAIEGLNGYVGIDLVMTEQGPVVLEINPRLTTAYAGLKRSLGANPAAMILETIQTGRFPSLPGVDYQSVTVRF